MMHKPKSAQTMNRKDQNQLAKENKQEEKNQPFSYNFKASSQKQNFLSTISASTTNLRIKHDTLSSQEKSINILDTDENILSSKKVNSFDRPLQIYSNQIRDKPLRRLGASASLSHYKKRPNSSQPIKRNPLQNKQIDEISQDREDTNYKGRHNQISKYKRNQNLQQNLNVKYDQANKNSESIPFQVRSIENNNKMHNFILMSKQHSPFKQSRQNQLSTIKNSKGSIDDMTSTLTNNFELQSIFTPQSLQKGQPNIQSQKFLSKQKPLQKFNKKQSVPVLFSNEKDRINSDDKENRGYLSNQKQKPKQQKNVLSPSEKLLSSDMVAKLRQEVQKQIQKKQTQQNSNQKSKKHLQSMIPFELKQKLRSKKLTKENIDDIQQNRLQLEEEKIKKRKQEIKTKRELERQEQKMYLDIMKKSLSNSPLRKKSSNKGLQKHKQLIKVESIDDFQNRVLNQINQEEISNLDSIIKRPRDGQSPTDQNYLSVMKESEIQQQDYIIQPKYTQSLLSQKGSPQKQQASISPSKKIKYNGQHFEYQPFKQSIINKEILNDDQENRHQNLENYQKEQKMKRIKIKRDKENKQSEKLLKLKSQLANLHIDYFKGVQEFKDKLKSQQIDHNSGKRGQSKKRKKSKRPKSKKQIFDDLISSQKRQQSEQRNRLDYIGYQRNSMPQLLGQTPKIILNPRGSFQSPQLHQFSMRTFDNLNSYQSQDFNSLQSSSPSIKNLVLGQDQLAKIRQQTRGSVTSQISINTNNFAQSQQESISLPFQMQSQPITLRQTAPNNNIFNIPKNSQLQSTEEYKKSSAKTTIRLKQGSQLIDLKSEKAIKMFQEFAKVRKQLAKQLQSEKSQISQDIQVKKKKVNIKKKQKIQDIPLKTQKNYSQLPLEQNLLIKNLNEQIQEYPINQYDYYQNQNDSKASNLKQNIIEKIQLVQEKIQSQYKGQNKQNQIYYSTGQQIPVQSLGNEGVNIIKEEESKDIEVTNSFLHQQSLRDQQNLNTYSSNDQQLQANHFLQDDSSNDKALLEEVSQIIKKQNQNEDYQKIQPQINLLEQQEEQIIRNNNTTLMLRKMYSEDENQNYSQTNRELLENAVINIQRHYRGYICRRIMKEKLRIDREFRLLRQKYQVKSSTNSNNTLNSLAFSQSKPLQRSSNPFKQIQRTQPHYITDDYQQIEINSQPKNDPKRLELEDQINLNTDFKLANHSEQFYVKGDVGFNGGIQASVFKSPEIEEQSNQRIYQNNKDIEESKEASGFYPTKLQFLDSQLNVNLLKDSELTAPVLLDEVKESQDFDHIKILEESDEQIDNKSFLNDEDTSRSQLPIEDQIPFININQNDQFLAQQPLIQNDNQTKEEIQAFQTNDDQSINISEKSLKDYLDSPLMINDLSQKVDQESEKIQIKRLVPRHIKQSDDSQAKQPIFNQQTQNKQSERELVQKPSFEISSLINFDEEQDKNLQGSNNQKQDAFHSVSNNFGSFQLDPYAEEEEIKQGDQSPNLTNNYLKDSGQQKSISKQKKDESMSNTSYFERNSFQQLVNKDSSKSVAFKAESEIEKIISDLNIALKSKIKIKEQELRDEQLSVRTYNRKKIELEKWVEKEKKEIKITKKHFMQGCMRLSSLLDHLVKEQGRMKDAVSTIRQNFKAAFDSNFKDNQKPLQEGVRRSHSFDSEYQQEQNEKRKSLISQNQDFDISDGFNTASGRRLSSNLDSSFKVVNAQQILNEKSINENVELLIQEDIKPLYSGDNQKPFDYRLYKIDSFKSELDKDQEDSKDEIIIEIKANHDNKGMDNNMILVDDKNQASPNLQSNLDDFQNLSDLSHTKLPIESPSKAFGYNSQSSQQPSNSLLDSIPNGLQLSDTPLYKNEGKEILKFPDELDSLDNVMKEQDQKVDKFVEEILQGILLREVKDRMFPPRPLSKLLKKQKSASTDKIQIQEGEIKLPAQAFEDQIKVLDHIIDELSPNGSIKKEDDDLSIKSRDSPNAVDDAKDARFGDSFNMNQKEDDVVEEQKNPESNLSPSKKGIETSIIQVNSYMQDIFERLRTDKHQMKSVLENVSQPLYKDPLMILAHLQNSIPDPPQQNSENDMNESDPAQQQFESAMPFQQSVLSVDLYLDIEKERRGGLSISQMRDSFHGESDNSQSFIAEMENIHNKAIFDAVNEALDGFRPYGLRGPPLPWSKNNKTLTFKFGKEETFDYLLQKVKFRILEWSHMQAGTLPKSKIMTQRERDHLELVREERLARILISEAEENEPLWIDYEYEETQTKIDVADIILEQLCGEVVQIMQNIKESRDDVQEIKQIEEVKEEVQ